MSMSKAERVRKYYDANTGLFLALGHSFDGTIHRAVWGPGTRTRRDALVYVEGLIEARIRALGGQGSQPFHLVDLGCGVGATLCRLAKLIGCRGTGITISKRQVELAAERIAAAGLTGQVSCQLGDFCDLTMAGSVEADAAYAIESFVLGTDAQAFFVACAKRIRPGGLLMICDDFVADASLLEDRRARGWLERFAEGWRAGSLIDPAQLAELAKSSGFVQEDSVDLSGYLELGRPRDQLIAALIRTLGWLPIRGEYWSMLYGGHALQVALQQGYMKYLFTTWRRES